MHPLPTYRSVPAIRSRLPLGLGILLAGVIACRPGMAHPGPGQEYARVVFGADTVVAEIASTPRAHETGLMFRDSVPDGTGMLFVFDEEEIRGFWMDNTYVDLDVAFMDASFRIVDIQHLEALDREVKNSRAPFMYAIEVRRGWLAEHGVAVGDVVSVERRPTGA